jgi:hypothetical protein
MTHSSAEMHLTCSKSIIQTYVLEKIILFLGTMRILRVCLIDKVAMAFKYLDRSNKKVLVDSTVAFIRWWH